MIFTHATRIWLAYAAILTLLTGVLGWFSWFTVCLDQQAQESRREIVLAEQEATQQERISRALWRMDWALSPFVAQEAARTHWMYQSFLTDPANPKPQPSPLLSRPSNWVLLHFQINEAEEVTSPQAPADANRMTAFACGVPESELKGNCNRLASLSGKLKFDPLWEQCSTTMLDQSISNSIAWGPQAMLPMRAPVGNGPDVDHLMGMNGNAAANQQEMLVDNGQFNQAAEIQSLDRSSKRNSNASQAVEYLQRGQSANSLAIGQWQANRYNLPPAQVTQAPTVTEGALRPIWFDGELVLLRRVDSQDGRLVQGCWLDWTAIKKSLLQEISDILPEADLVPREGTSSEQFGNSLAILPVDVAIASPQAIDVPKIIGGSSPGMRSTLLIAWSGLLIGAISTGWLILGVTRLSERRAAFASAVTHELRTPLTTFRLYSEMLDSNMITDEAQRQSYTAGLVRESDRLCRLVENVLQFARLEQKRSITSSSRLTIDQLIETMLQRSRTRAESSNMKLELVAPETVRSLEICTSVDLVEQIVFNLVDNACKYASDAARPEICIEVSEEAKWILISVRDFGNGIDAKMLKRLFQPFSRSSDETAGTAAGVGLGLSLSRKLAKQIGGRLDYRQSNPGSTFELRLRLA